MPEAKIQEALVIRPGDKLLVRVQPSTDPEQIRRFTDRLKERFPTNEITVVAAEQLAVIREDSWGIG
jgi:hypothetical protein